MSDFLQVPNGLVLPLVLRLDQRGEIDWMRMEEVVWEYIKRGVYTFFLASTTGRVHELDAHARAKLYARVHDICVGHATTLMVGCMDTCLERMLGHLHEVARRGCQMVVASPPWYARLAQYELANADQTGVLDIFAQEAANKRVSVVLYDIPSCVGTPMSTETIVRLSETHKNVVAVKDSSGENRVAELARVVPYYTGREDQLLEAMRAGASGGVFSLAHNNPGLFQFVIEHAGSEESGMRDKVEQVQGHISWLFWSVRELIREHEGAFSSLMRYLEMCTGLHLCRGHEAIEVTVGAGVGNLWRHSYVPDAAPVRFGG